MSEKEKNEIIDSLMNTIENLKKENVELKLRLASKAPYVCTCKTCKRRKI